MTAEEFRRQLMEYCARFRAALSTESGDWAVKGFIDVYRNIYTISVDTKVISKIIELMLFPLVSLFAEENAYKMFLCEYQNHYPDVTFVAKDGTKIALDLKSTYRTGENTVNGFTLGCFTGYFRHRETEKNITFPYRDYAAHVVLGVIYSRADECLDERRLYSVEELPSILSVVKDFEFLVQEKWRIAGARPGSGNTKNIGSVNRIADLVGGTGPFAPLGEEVFDDYWTNYLTEDMARAIDSKVPYRNLQEYLEWRKPRPRAKSPR
jgi:hypothetical protein